MICYLRTKRLKEWALLGSFVCFKQVPVKLVWQVELEEWHDHATKRQH